MTDWVHVREILDQQFPLHEYSVDDRLNVLIFLLRSQGEMKIKWKKALEEDAYIPLQDALWRGDVRSFKASRGKEESWKVLQFIIRGASHRKSESEMDAYVTIKRDFDRLYSLPFSVGTKVGAEDLQRRGYLMAEDRGRSSGRLNPENVHTFPELLMALHDHRAVRGNPPWRTMASNSKNPCHGGRAEWHQPRSHTALREMLLPGSRPSLPAVLAFIRGCGALSHEREDIWAEAHARAVRSVER